MKKEKNRLIEILICILTTIFAWIFFIVFLYSANVKEVNIIEAKKPLIIFSVCALLAMGVGLIIYRSIGIASMFSIMLAILLTNFSLILSIVQKVIPQVRYWHLLYMDVAVTIILMFIAKKYSNYVMLVIRILFVVYMGLIVMNLVMAAPTIIRKVNAGDSSQNETEARLERREGTNIYYILCDEYGSFDQLKQEYGYENSEFREFLTENKFNISDDSYNYTNSTHVAFSNLMSLDYVADENSTVVELENFCKNGVLHDILGEVGYTQRGIGETDWIGFDGTIAAQEGARTADGESFEIVALKNTFFSVLVQSINTEAAQEILASLNDFIDMPIVPNSSEFVMIYIKAPHHPYYFKKDGSMNVPSKYSNADGTNSESYLGEIEWLNGYLEEGISHIIKSDPESIIVLCSDHGNRFGIKNTGLCEKILNVIYYKGQPCEEIKNLSGINTIKYILNNEVGTTLEYTDDSDAK